MKAIVKKIIAGAASVTTAVCALAPMQAFAADENTQERVYKAGLAIVEENTSVNGFVCGNAINPELNEENPDVQKAFDNFLKEIAKWMKLNGLDEGVAGMIRTEDLTEEELAKYEAAKAAFEELMKMPAETSIATRDEAVIEAANYLLDNGFEGDLDSLTDEQIKLAAESLKVNGFVCGNILFPELNEENEDLKKFYGVDAQTEDVDFIDSYDEMMKRTAKWLKLNGIDDGIASIIRTEDLTEEERAQYEAAKTALEELKEICAGVELDEQVIEAANYLLDNGFEGDLDSLTDEQIKLAAESLKVNGFVCGNILFPELNEIDESYASDERKFEKTDVQTDKALEEAKQYLIEKGYEKELEGLTDQQIKDAADSVKWNGFICGNAIDPELENMDAVEKTELTEEAILMNEVNETKLSGSRKLKVAGDANCDGTVDVSDVVLIARLTSEDEDARITAQGKVNADFNDDGTVNLQDGSGILNVIAKNI